MICENENYPTKDRTHDLLDTMLPMGWEGCLLSL